MVRKAMGVNAKPADGQWFAVLGDLPGTAAPVWPVKPCVHKDVFKGEEYMEFAFDLGAKSEEVNWLCMFSAGDYQACCYEWRSPAWQSLFFG